MIYGLKGYIYNDYTVVIDKSDIKGNPPDENFRPVRLFIDEKYIRQWYEELEKAKETGETLGVAEIDW